MAYRYPKYGVNHWTSYPSLICKSFKNRSINLTGRVPERKTGRERQRAYVCWPDLPDGPSSQARAGCFLHVSHMGARTQALESSCTTFPGTLVEFWIGCEASKTQIMPLIDFGIADSSLTPCATELSLTPCKSENFRFSTCCFLRGCFQDSVLLRKFENLFYFWWCLDSWLR